MTTIVSISDEYITLGQFLKHIDVITTGGQAKWYLQEYTVFVDGELENRRGRKLYPNITSLVSAITRRKVRPHLAMTGEITLRGKVLPVGGIKEKILAAKRSGITDIILCRENEKDILEINERYLDGLTFHYVDEISEVLSFALLDERAGEPNK